MLNTGVKYLHARLLNRCLHKKEKVWNYVATFLVSALLVIVETTRVRSCFLNISYPYRFDSPETASMHLRKVSMFFSQEASFS